MLFTVFQYIPILEEETHAHKTELAKKAKKGDLSGGDNDNTGDDCDDDDTEQEFNYSDSTLFAIFSTDQKSHISYGKTLYKYLLESKDTPPPRI